MENLKAFIPSVINQDYHDFEIILINDGSSDDTLSVMKSFETENDHVRIVDVKPVEAVVDSNTIQVSFNFS